MQEQQLTQFTGVPASCLRCRLNICRHREVSARCCADELQAQQALLNVPWDEHVLALPGCQAAVDGERRLLFSGPRVRMGRLPRCISTLCSTRLWVTSPGLFLVHFVWAGQC